MNFEEMQTLWADMSRKLEQQQLLNDKIILQMTQERYQNRLKSISFYEGIGAVICYVTGAIILFNIKEMDTWYLVACALFTLLFLFVIPILSLRSIKQMKAIDLAENSYKDSLIIFARRRKHFLFIQRLGIFLGLGLMLAVIPVFSKLFDGEDIFLKGNFFTWYMPFVLVFFVLFARWGYRCYSNATASAEKILREVEDR